MSNRSAGLISRRHSDENSVEFKVFETENFNINEEACGDRPHPMSITLSSNHHYQLQLQLPDVYILNYKNCES